ncbi:MAG TPA: hypothetical protein DCQ36_04555 [Actinobacteria bacterium]|nr:hypothetical protein [Actinomycetota bacterium]
MRRSPENVWMGTTRNAVSFMVLEETGLLDVEVRDDGPGPGPESRLGMGTRLLEESTLDWSRRAGSPGQVLTARIPGAPRVR